MKTTFAERVVLANAIFRGEFYRCPVTGKILDSGDPGDDKVICHCKKALADGGTHSKRGLVKATAEEYVKQWEGVRR